MISLVRVKPKRRMTCAHQLKNPTQHTWKYLVLDTTGSSAVDVGERLCTQKFVNLLPSINKSLKWFQKELLKQPLKLPLNQAQLQPKQPAPEINLLPKLILEDDDAKPEMNETPGSELFEKVLSALPQTQCPRCGYPDCASYARAVVFEGVPINQCPPGGIAGIEILAAITGQTAVPLNSSNGTEGPLFTAWIDEDVCIGCTLCIHACPTDAILGTNKKMHTVVEKYCTGCELCIPVCPVDCIYLDNISGTKTAWSAWSPSLADQARSRFAARGVRFAKEEEVSLARLSSKALEHLEDLDQTTHMPLEIGSKEHTNQVKRKTDIIQAALTRAQDKIKQMGKDKIKN